MSEVAAGHLISDVSSDEHEPSRPPDSEVRAQIERIIKSKLFADSARLQRFLTWTVDQVLQGEPQNIKQFTIGQEVFDRGAGFDPRIDSIVRTEAQRLRRKLSEYYRNQGVSDSILVSFEAGSYVPILKTRQEASTRGRSNGIEAIPKTSGRPATAVMPFLNLTGYADQDYLCRGIAESIQERLANSPSLKVISTDSAFRFAADRGDLATMGHELGVKHVVEGSLQILASRLRVQAKVVDVSTGSYIWARVFDRGLADVFVVQDEIARAVFDAVTEHSGADSSKGNPGTPNPDIYRLYLRGRHFWNKVTIGGCEEAVRCFVRTISAAPEYAPAYTALAEAYYWLIFLGARNPSQLARVTRRLVLEALRLDRNCPEAYIGLAVSTAGFEWQWTEAEGLFERGLELRPNYVAGYMQRVVCRLEQGLLEDSRRDIEKALDLDPLSARSHRGGGLRYYLLRDFANALLSFDRALELGPDIENTHYYRGLALLQLGRSDDAIAALTQSLEPSTAGARLGALVRAYTAGGYGTKAEETLQALHQRLADASASPVAFVHAYAAPGQISEALHWLERAAHERYTGMMYLKLDPLYDCLRSEPAFQAVLKQTNLL